MASTIAVVGVAAAGAILAVGFAGVGAAAVVSQRAASTADAAALAAADAASGAVPGVPCERAVEVASVSGATLLSCELDELVATVWVRVAWGVLASDAGARAGPPV